MEEPHKGNTRAFVKHLWILGRQNSKCSPPVSTFSRGSFHTQRAKLWKQHKMRPWVIDKMRSQMPPCPLPHTSQSHWNSQRTFSKEMDSSNITSAKEWISEMEQRRRFGICSCFLLCWNCFSPMPRSQAFFHLLKKCSFHQMAISFPRFQQLSILKRLSRDLRVKW